MTSILHQGSSLSSYLTFRSPKPAIISFRIIDLVLSPVWRETETNIKISSPREIGHALVGLCDQYTHLAWCVLAQLGVGKPSFMSGAPRPQPRASGSRPPGSNSPLRGYVYHLVPEVPLFRGMLTGSEAFFVVAGRVEATALSSESPKRALCQTRPVAGLNDKYQLPSRSRTCQFRRTLPPAALILYICSVNAIYLFHSLSFLFVCFFFFWLLTEHNNYFLLNVEK